MTAGAAVAQSLRQGPLVAALGLVGAYAVPVMVSSTAPQALPLFAYLAVVSQYLGFFAWYRGLAIGPMAQVSQVQLVQPVLTIVSAVLLLGEELTWPTVLGATQRLLAG